MNIAVRCEGRRGDVTMCIGIISKILGVRQRGDGAISRAPTLQAAQGSQPGYPAKIRFRSE